MFGGAGIRGRGRPGRVIGRVLAVVTAVAAFTVAAPGVQQADAAAPCPGRLARTVTFSTGELRVYERGNYACAVTLAKRPGVRRSMSVSLQPRGGRADTDSGRFTRQAGPVTVHALNRCVRATGSVSGTSRSTGWILC
ncbi:hypothetical protein [Streptomyces sp. Tu 2975]|uniref:hypothetical protein n=1 Tax=Streptomyces sp. Tu 2975 TaxID=2676871 RepID=UPI00135B3124|nr:hypothetical protein [Streptomyces sp. Tu 2975]